MNKENNNAFIKTKFNNVLVDLLTILKKRNKQHKQDIMNYYNYFISNLDTNFINFIIEFNSLMNKHNKEIVIEDDILFSDDYMSTPVYLLKGINFKLLWKNFKDVEEKQLAWKKIKILYSTSIYIVTSTNEYKDLYEKQKEIMKNLVDSMTFKHNKNREMEDEINENHIKYEEIIEKFGNNIFTDIIIEIIKELGLNNEEKGNENLIKIINSFVKQNPNELKPLIDRIADKISELLKLKNMTTDDFIKEIEKIKDKMGDILNTMPQLKELMDTIISNTSSFFSKNNDNEQEFDLLRNLKNKLSNMENCGLIDDINNFLEKSYVKKD